MTTATDSSPILVPSSLDPAIWTPARLARYERMDVYFDRDRVDTAYKRDRQAESIRTYVLPRMREGRRLDRLNRERGAIQYRSLELWRRRQKLYGDRQRAIEAHLIAEHRIRLPGKTESSKKRFRSQLSILLAEYPKYRALIDRYDRANRLMERLRSRRLYDELAAGVIGGDDRATRHAKRWAWLRRQTT